MQGGTSPTGSDNSSKATTSSCVLSDQVNRLMQPVTAKDIPIANSTARRMLLILPNVKHEPRPWPPGIRRKEIVESGSPFDSTYNSRRRDGHGRWLWRLVRPCCASYHGHQQNPTLRLVQSGTAIFFAAVGANGAH